MYPEFYYSCSFRDLSDAPLALITRGRELKRRPHGERPCRAAGKKQPRRDDIAKGNWWEIFGDPVLNDLETQTTSANESLKAAIARVTQARAIARIAEADFFPTIDLGSLCHTISTVGEQAGAA